MKCMRPTVHSCVRRAVGIVVLLISLVVAMGLLVVETSALRGTQLTAAVLGIDVDVVLRAGGFLVFTPNWVRVPAEAYAERLREACETL